MAVLITGASGFVGSAILAALSKRGIHSRPVFRSASSVIGFVGEGVIVPTLDGETDWSKVLFGVDTVIHAAGRAHIMREESLDPLLEYRRVNVQGSLNLARQSALAGVKRFLFISSIKVNGGSTQLGQPFVAEDAFSPEDAYGISKAEAELGLRQICSDTGMEFTIIRPTLVYGPGVKGNFLYLFNWVARGWPLPLGGVIYNRRSFVALDNLVDLILTCVTHPNAANQTFLVSDDEDVSTLDLLKKIGKAMNRPVHLLPVPVALLEFAANLSGRRDVAQRLLGSLQVDISKTCEQLSWKPPVSMSEGLRRAVKRGL